MKIILFFVFSLIVFNVCAQDRYQTTPAEKFKIVKNEKSDSEQNYPLGMLNEFVNYFYKTKIVNVYKDSTVTNYFRYKAIWLANENEVVLTLSWQNYADGLQWDFWGETVSRNPKDAWKIVKNEMANKAMKEYVKQNLAENAITDVFEYETIECQTSQKTENIDFDVETDSMNGYGIVYKKTTYLFNQAGQFTNKEELD